MTILLAALLALAAAPAASADPGLEPLRNEHALTVLILDEAERAAAAAERRGEFDRQRIGRMVDFFGGFVDACHHAKEERHLFPSLREAGGADVDSVVAVLTADHERGRELIRRLQGGLRRLRHQDGPRPAAVAADLAIYASLLRDHIRREDELFARAERLLDPATRASLGDAYERLERDELGSGYHERYHGVAERILRERP